MNTTATPDTDHTNAWAFILRHTSMMERLAYRFGPRNPDDREEWLRDVTIRVVEKFVKYDPSRSAPQTWIVWQMRAVSATWQRRFTKRCREGYGKAEALVLIPVGPTQHGSCEHAHRSEAIEDAEIIVSGLYSEATPEQQVAIRTFLAGMKATELRKRHGMTGRERTTHLHALRAHVQEA